LGERGGEDHVLDDLRRNDFTWSAPGCETVEDDDTILDGLSEGGFAALGVLANSSACACHCAGGGGGGGGGEAYVSIFWTPILTIVL